MESRTDAMGHAMTEPKRLRIFISSPGDVGEERVIAGCVVARLASEFGQFLTLEPILWEHEPLRATGHFQEQIIPPSKTDIVVCVLWSRLGTRLPEGFKHADGTAYASGTEWEFEDAARSYRERGTPDLLVYRKTREVFAGLDDKQALLRRLEQKEALDAFIDRWFGSADDSFKAAFHTFETTDAFEGLLEIHLRKLIEERLPEHLTAAEEGAARISWHKGSPFRGLEAFDFEHAPVFFGRTRAVGEVKEAIEAQAARGTAFLIVFGMSGSGKSSLLRAGLLPTISQTGVVERIGLWRRCIFRPGDATGDLFDGLAQALLADTALPELAAAKWDRAKLAEQFRSAPHLAAQPIDQALALVDKAKLTASAEVRLVLVVDQMEELFTLERVDDEVCAGFIGVLSALAKGGQVWVIGAMRSDFYHRCAEAPELVTLSEGAGQVHLVPPAPPEIAQIIRNPVRAAGLRFEVAAETGERLDDVLHAAAARAPAALPLLEFTLEELFKQRTEDGVLTFEAYERLGGLAGAVTRQAEEVFGGLAKDARDALPAVLRALVTVGAEAEQPVATRRVPLETVASTPERKALVDAFIKARLLVTDHADDGTAVVRIVHDALLSHWPRLQAWLEQDREVLRARGRVAAATARWRQEGESDDLLLPEGKLLAEAEALLERRDELEPGVVRYIDVSAAAYRRRLEAAKTATEGIYEWNIETDELYVSDRGKAFWLGESDDLRSDSWNRRVHPEDFAKYRQAIVAHFKGLTDHMECEYRVRDQAGTYRWVVERAICVRNKDGRAVRQVGAVTDINERKRVEAALRESEKRYTLAMEALHEGVYDWNIPTGEVYYSPRMREMLGLSPEDLRTARDWLVRVHPEDLDRYQAELAAHFKGETDSFSCDYRVRGKGGEWRWARQQGSALRDEDGRAYRMVGSTGDITEQKELERALEMAQNRPRDAVDAVSEGFVLYDAEDRLVLCNDTYRTMYLGLSDIVEPGTPFEAIILEAAERGLIPEAEGDVDGWVAARMARHRSPSGPYLQRHADGRWVQVSERKTENGGTAAVYTDITELKRSEAELAQNSALLERRWQQEL